MLDEHYCSDRFNFDLLRFDLFDAPTLPATADPRGHVPACKSEALRMLWTIFVALLILWLLGLGLHFGGVLINLLLVVALAVLVIQLSGPRATV